MGFFRMLTVNTFSHDAEGRSLLCTRLPRRRCYVVPPERKDEWLQFIRWYWVGMLAAVVASVGVFELFWSILVPIPLCIAVVWWRVRRFTRTLEETDAKPVETKEELLRREVQATGPATLWFFEIFALTLVAGGVVFFINGDRVLGVACAAIFGWVAWEYAKRIRIERKINA